MNQNTNLTTIDPNSYKKTSEWTLQSYSYKFKILKFNFKQVYFPQLDFDFSSHCTLGLYVDLHNIIIVTLMSGITVRTHLLQRL